MEVVRLESLPEETERLCGAGGPYLCATQSRESLTCISVMLPLRFRIHVPLLLPLNL